MSSGTDVQLVNAITPVNHNLQNDTSGFQSVNEYQRFSMAADHFNFVLKNMDKFLSTTNVDVLTFIGRSKFVGQRTKEAVNFATNPWRPDAVKSILKFLKHIPFELSILIDNDLGYALKNIKKTATNNNDTEIVTMSSKLISEWKELQSKPLNSNNKRDSPERSSTSPPAPEAKKLKLAPAPEAKKLKLAIQKDPPVRPKAMADPNFLTTLGEQKKFRRPVYVVDENDGNVAKNTVAVIPNSPVIASPPTNRRRVTFSDNLVEIREYEKNPEEWSSFDNQADELDRFYSSNTSQKSNQMEIPKQHFNIPSVNWYQPLELSFNIDENPSIVIPKLIRTEESASQDRREKIALAAIYISPQHIPASPSEPDEVPDPNENTRVIPLEDVNDGYNPPQPQQSTPPLSPVVAMPISLPVTQPAPQPVVQPVSQPVVDPSQISPATLSALASALNNPSLIPQQTFQPAPQPQIVQQPAPVFAQPSFAPQQNEISNSTVESMLKNNPGIMNSLKQLSFLAGNNTPSPQAQPATVVNYQQDTTSTPQYMNNNNINNNGGNRFPNHNNVTRGGGRGGRGGRGRGGMNFNNNRPGACAFFNTPEGCRNGDSCPYGHIL